MIEIISSDLKICQQFVVKFRERIESVAVCSASNSAVAQFSWQPVEWMAVKPHFCMTERLDRSIFYYIVYLPRYALLQWRLKIDMDSDLTFFSPSFRTNQILFRSVAVVDVPFTINIKVLCLLISRC